MNKIDTTNINGYIEGYYGNILTWGERNRIVKNLNQNKFNSYFYCPKEDIYHRFNWRRPYPKKWQISFQNFCKNAIKLNIDIFCGISPGLDFDFFNSKEDFNLLVSKAKILLKLGAKNIVLMFDDIPDDFKYENLSETSEGLLHAKFANLLSKELKINILIVPRVYSEEITNKGNYIKDLCKVINKKISIFYCGKKIVADSQSSNETSLITNYTNNNIIIWDNLYANDYCPNKIFLGPYLKRDNLKNIMVNLTGMIETDLFLLDLISNTDETKDTEKNWLKTLDKHKIPEQFLIISKFFFPINYQHVLNYNKINYCRQIDALEFLLWKWKTSLSREWYKYLLILKHSLQLLHGDINKNRIRKIYPVPLKDINIIKNRGNKK